MLLGSRQYSTGIDMWSIGCIFAEMITRKPLFPGDSEIDEIFQIFRVLGTPNEDIWPGVTTLPNFKSTFPQWSRKDIRRHISGIDEYGADLLLNLLNYDPALRISAKRSLLHPYFSDYHSASGSGAGADQQSRLPSYGQSGLRV